MSDEPGRRCPHCETVKATDAFPSNTPQGVWCLMCHRLRARERRAANPTGGAADQRKRRNDPQKRAQDRAAMKAHSKAMSALAARHVDEYLTLLDAARADVGLPPANPRQVRSRLGRASRSLMPDEETR